MVAAKIIHSYSAIVAGLILHPPLSSPPREIPLFSQDGVTALIAANMNGHVKVVKVLLDKGADTTAKDKVGGLSGGDRAPLPQQILVANTAAPPPIQCHNRLPLLTSSPPYGSQLGSTALIQASIKGHVEVVKVLLDKGAGLEAKDKVGGWRGGEGDRKGGWSWHFRDYEVLHHKQRVVATALVSLLAADCR